MRRVLPALAFACMLSAGALAAAAGRSPQDSTASVAAPAESANPVARGRYLAVLGDCAGCHTRPGGAPYAGGLGLGSSFGTIYTANITSDPKAGIGSWTADQFWRAMHEGRRADGAHLYPAFPYVYFTRVSREDSDALRAYLLTVPASDYTPPANKLLFPVNIRGTMSIWNALFFKPEAFQPRADQSAEWNRGAYIVTGLGHCGACHTPKNLLQADSRSKPLQGGKIEDWFAPDLDGSARGLGGWSQDDIVEFLKTGRNTHSNGGAAMASVLIHSTTQMSDEDRRDIAIYLKSLPPSEGPAAHPAPSDLMAEGGAIYRDQCSACHGVDGAGEPRLFPALRNNANAQQRDPTTMVRYILTGSQTTATGAAPTPFTMPAFAWKLNDREIAAVATYVRNRFGNAAPPVSTGDVADLARLVTICSLRVSGRPDRGRTPRNSRRSTRPADRRSSRAAFSETEQRIDVGAAATRLAYGAYAARVRLTDPEPGPAVGAAEGVLVFVEYAEPQEAEPLGVEGLGLEKIAPPDRKMVEVYDAVHPDNALSSKAKPTIRAQVPCPARSWRVHAPKLNLRLSGGRSGPFSASQS